MRCPMHNRHRSPRTCNNSRQVCCYHNCSYRNSSPSSRCNYYKYKQNIKYCIEETASSTDDEYQTSGPNENPRYYVDKNFQPRLNNENPYAADDRVEEFNWDKKWKPDKMSSIASYNENGETTTESDRTSFGYYSKQSRQICCRTKRSQLPSSYLKNNFGSSSDDEVIILKKPAVRKNPTSSPAIRADPKETQRDQQLLASSCSQHDKKSNQLPTACSKPSCAKDSKTRHFESPGSRHSETRSKILNENQTNVIEIAAVPKDSKEIQTGEELLNSLRYDAYGNEYGDGSRNDEGYVGRKNNKTRAISAPTELSVFTKGGSYPLKKKKKKKDDKNGGTAGVRLGRPGSPLIMSNSKRTGYF